MAKILFLFFLAVLLCACNNNCQELSGSVQKAESGSPAACPVPTPDPGPTPDPSPEPSPDPDGDVPNEALTFDSSVQLFEFDRNQEEKVLKAIEIIKKVIASRDFRSRVLNFTYLGKKQFVDNRGMTNGQIYQSILEAKENLRPVIDNKMDLELQLYYSWRDIVGYTTPGELRIYMNTKFFNPYSASQVAGNVFHEWTHKLGFDHAQNYSVSRDSSVPYALGYLVEELGKQYE